MDSITKNEIKDYLILSLIDTLSEVVNLENKNLLKNNFINKLKELNILDIDVDTQDNPHNFYYLIEHLLFL